jgi:hypothetical protein
MTLVGSFSSSSSRTGQEMPAYRLLKQQQRQLHKDLWQRVHQLQDAQQQQQQRLVANRRFLAVQQQQQWCRQDEIQQQMVRQETQQMLKHA